MRVAANALHLVPGETGGLEPYARRLLPALAAIGVELEVHAAREGAPALRDDGLTVVEHAVSARSRPRRVLAEQTSLPRALRRSRPDLLHNLFSTAPALAGVPQVTTIHDVNYRTAPSAHLGLMGRGMALLVPLAARRSARVITVSAAARDELVRHLPLEAAGIDVVHNGPGLPLGDSPPSRDELCERFGVDGPLILTVTALRPHKNLEGLLDALALVDGVLVAPGYSTGHEAELRAHAERAGVAERVRFAGWVDDATLDGLYRACDVFVFPSLAEGFGLPVVEALARGAAVACSDIPVLREVAGEDATFFDPRDPRSIADAIRRARPATAPVRFSWEEAARGTLRSYERALASARS